MVKYVIAKLDSLKASGPNCLLAVFLKNSDPKPSYILVEFSIIGWRSLIFQIVGRSH